MDRTGFRFPAVGERHNPSALPVEEAVLGALLEGSAYWHQVAHCEDDDCEVCNTFRLAWWDAYNTLSQPFGKRLQAQIRAGGGELPDAAWEDCLPDGTILPRPWEA